MNFPDLKTCRAIGAEFSESEFVWVNLSYPINPPRHPVNIFDLDGPEPLEIAACLRVEVELYYDTIANAPICEELGEWLWEHKALVSRSSNNWTTWRLHTPDIEGIIEFEATDETRARAQAVIMVMAELKSNNEED